ncbi:MAG TPA: hypothetical protein VM818_03020 [Vicinamibacterales bacterium]|nr:hypothetical protein [Vicinamibacterales bacterium]
MPVYTFHDLSLHVEPAELETRADLARLWAHLSWDLASEAIPKPVGRLRIRLHEQGGKVPSAARLVLRTESFCGFEQDEDFFLSDGESLFHLVLSRAQGDAYLAPSFFSKPAVLRDNFWSFGLVKLLRPFGLYTLHAAGLMTPDGEGLLVVGPSDSGKTTLALGLVRNGWHFLSDDAVLLSRAGQPSTVDELGRESKEVVARALRAHFYIDSAAASTHRDVQLGREVDDGVGGRRRRVFMTNAYARQKMSACVPRMLLFSKIVPQERSQLIRLNEVTAFTSLLDASGRQTFDRRTMASQLDLLKRLVRQAASYELRAGRDMHADSSRLIPLLKQADRNGGPWRASSWS